MAIADFDLRTHLNPGGRWLLRYKNGPFRRDLTQNQKWAMESSGRWKLDKTEGAPCQTRPSARSDAAWQTAAVPSREHDPNLWVSSPRARLQVWAEAHTPVASWRSFWLCNCAELAKNQAEGMRRGREMFCGQHLPNITESLSCWLLLFPPVILSH